MPTSFVASRPPVLRRQISPIIVGVAAARLQPAPRLLSWYRHHGGLYSRAYCGTTAGGSPSRDRVGAGGVDPWRWRQGGVVVAQLGGRQHGRGGRCRRRGWRGRRRAKAGTGSAACFVAERLNHSKWRCLRYPGLSCPARHGRYPERCQCHGPTQDATQAICKKTSFQHAAYPSRRLRCRRSREHQCSRRVGKRKRRLQAQLFDSLLMTRIQANYSAMPGGRRPF